MSDHEAVRELLALSAAGLLEADEERLVRQHAGECAACAGALEEFAALSEGLCALPAPAPPAYLVTRTAALMATERDRREGAVAAGVVAVFGFVFVLTVGQMLRVFLGDSVALGWIVFAVISSVFGAAAGLVLGSRRGMERSIV